MSNDAYGHIPVLLEEAITALNIKPDGSYLDCTFGRGGHSRKILSTLQAKGKLIQLTGMRRQLMKAKKFTIKDLKSNAAIFLSCKRS